MPRGSWTKKDERKYEKILDSCKLERRKGKKRTVATCKRIAAATVNRDRKVRLGSTSGGTRLPPGHQKLHDSLKAAELFESLVSYGDSADDRRAAYALAKQRYPRADFLHLIPGYGLGLEKRRKGLRGTPEQHADRAGFYQRKLHDYLLEGKKPGDSVVERTLGEIQAEAGWVWQGGAGRDQFRRIHRTTKDLLNQANALAKEGSRMELHWGLDDGGDDGLFGLRGLRGETDDEEMWRKAAELWRDYYREHQPMTPAERRAFLAEKRAWLHSQEARDMGEASPGYGWSYNDEDD
jgi:hypothetical protein